MMLHNLPHSAARVLALAEIQHNPDEVFDEFQFSGADIGLPSDEYIVVKYFRRKVKGDRLQQMYVTTPVLEYAGEGVA